MRHPTVVAACLASTARAYGPETLSNETASPTSAPAPLSAFESREELLDAIEHWYDDEGHADGWWRGEDRYGPIGAWDTSRVADMSRLFCYADYCWPHSHVGAMTFDEDISAWDTSRVTDFSLMFRGANAFNQPIGAWDTSSVTDMSYMFRGADAFDGDVGSWDTSEVATAVQMFKDTYRFDQDLSQWDVSRLADMRDMFAHAAAFDQDLSAWSVPCQASFFHGSACEEVSCGLSCGGDDDEYVEDDPDITLVSFFLAATVSILASYAIISCFVRLRSCGSKGPGGASVHPIDPPDIDLWEDHPAPAPPPVSSGGVASRWDALQRAAAIGNHE